MFADREQGLGKEVVYYVGHLGQFENEEDMKEEEDVPTEMSGQGYSKVQLLQVIL